MADWGRERQKMESHLQSLLISYDNDCKCDPELQGYDDMLKPLISNAVEGGGGPGGAFGICEQSIKALGYSNKKAFEEIKSFKKDIRNRNWKWNRRTTRKYEATFNLVADKYINYSEDLLEFVAEINNFQKKAQNSCKFIKHETQRYFQMKKERGTLDQCAGGSTYYLKVWNLIKNLKDPEDICESSTNMLLEKWESLYKKQSEMYDSLIEQEGKLDKKQKFTPWWKRAKNFIFMGTVAGMLIAAVVMTAIGAAPIAGTILSFLPPTIGGGHWLGSCFAKYRDSVNYKEDLTCLMLQGARDSKNELVNIKRLIKNLAGELDALLLHPSSTTDEGKIDFTMELIDSNLGIILNQTEALEKEANKFSNEILKARDEVHIRRLSL